FVGAGIGSQKPLPFSNLGLREIKFAILCQPSPEALVGRTASPSFLRLFERRSNGRLIVRYGRVLAFLRKRGRDAYQAGSRSGTKRGLGREKASKGVAKQVDGRPHLPNLLRQLSSKRG